MSDCGHFDFGANDPVAARIGLGTASLRYIRLGYSVLPLIRGGKKPHRMLPLEPGGVHNASRSPVQAEARWGLDPAANVGVATGKVSNLVVADLDIKGLSNGVESLTVFLRTTGMELPAGIPVVHTPSGGMHLWMRWWDGWDVPERPGILPGVDIKGNGGLVVAPPSMLVHSAASRPGEPGGGTFAYPYYWADGCPCQAPQAPKWLAQWISSAPSVAADGSTHDIGEPAPELAELVKTGIEVGQRNDTLYRLACSRYRYHGTGPEASLRVIEEVRAVYDVSDHAGMGWHEVLVIIQSARKFIESREAAELAQWTAYQNRHGLPG
ncbi:MAG: bifunctional DNA primase/polymerase [Streptosporangiaceae bacterium]